MSANSIVHHVGAIKALKNLRESVDPASGLCVKVWRGPLSESDVPDGAYVELAICDKMHEVLAHLIEAEEISLKCAVSLAKHQVSELEAAIRLTSER